MIVLCFLQPQSLAQIHRAFPRPNWVGNAHTWDALVSDVQRGRCDITIIDPCMGGDRMMARRLETLTSGLGSPPAIPVVGYLSVSASAMRAVDWLVRFGAAEIVIRGVDDSIDALSATIHRVVAASAVGRVVRAVGGPLDALPSGVASAVHHAFRKPEHVRSVDDLAAVAKTTRRSLDRWLARAGLSPARTLLACARVNAAFHLLAAGNGNVRQAALALGYASPRSLAREVHAVTGYPIAAIPTALSRDTLVAALAQRLVRSSNNAATIGPLY